MVHLYVSIYKLELPMEMMMMALVKSQIFKLIFAIIFVTMNGHTYELFKNILIGKRKINTV